MHTMSKKLISLFCISILSFSSSLLAEVKSEKADFSESMNEIGKSIAQGADNVTIEAKVLAKFSGDSALSVFDLYVSANKGLVKLSGTLDNDEQYERTIMHTLSVKGVEKVDVSNLNINNPQASLVDININATVKARIISAGLFSSADPDNWRLKITTKDGIVSVVGFIDSDEIKTKLSEIINSVEGVKEVNNNLKIG